MVWQSLLDQLRFFKQSMQRPVITEAQGHLAIGSSPLTFVVIVGPGFNQTVPNAGTMCRLGWCRGFEQLGIPYVILSFSDLAARLPEIPGPLCWISGSDYPFLSPRALKTLKRYRHAVWVNTWFDGDTAFFQQHDIQNNSWPEAHNRKVLSSEPPLLFTISPTCRFEYYASWIREGAHLVSLPLACDATLYRTEAPYCPEFSNVEMAFVGGYWPYKARQFDRYLKPYQERLTVYGYSRWPYAGYGGQLPEEKEPSLYHQARLSPTINEPHVEAIGVDLNERVFKVLGSGGMTVTDVTPPYQEWFDESELLVPDSLEVYHEMVQQALTDESCNARYRQAGHAAVMARHTYVHRARALMSYLGLEPPEI